MDNKLRVKVPRCQELAIPRERFDRNEKDDPFKVKRGALSYRITDSLNMLAKPKRTSFQDEPIDYSTPRVPNKVLSIKDAERVARSLTSRERVAKILTSRKRNQLGVDKTYAQMVKRGPSNVKSSIDYLPLRESNLRIEARNCTKPITHRPRNHQDLDIYAQMVVNNDKQCPSRIKSLAKPRRSYFDIDELSTNYDHDD